MTSNNLKIIFLLLFYFVLFNFSSKAQNTYNVGPGFPKTTLSQVPWNTLGPGDTVNIYHNGSSYKEKFLISTSGISGQPITIRGIAGPNGQKPVIDGDNAISYGGQCYATESYGLITIEPGQVNGGCPNGAYSDIPHDIIIDGLEIKNCHPNFTYSLNGGSQQPYSSFACGIYAERVQNLVVRNCNFNHCGLGLFINSKYGTHALSKNILIEKNLFTQNGVIGDGHDHNSYIEAINVVYQYNYFDALIPGAFGASLKDRSAGNIIRYNWIVGSQGHAIQIPETQGGMGVIDQDPNYRKTFIYGNVIVNNKLGATRIIRYGGDQGIYANYRQGTLYFYNNTVISEGDRDVMPHRRYTTQLFLLPDKGEVGNVAISETIDCRNNIIYNQAGTNGAVPTTLELLSTDLSGTLNMTNNWLSPNITDTHAYYQTTAVGTVTHTNTIYGNNGSNNPGFNDYSNGDYRLLPLSNAINQGTSLPNAATPFPVIEEYIKHFASQVRTVVGAVDLGAFENSAIDQIPVTSISVTPSDLALIVGQKATLTAVVLPVNADNKSYIWSSSNTNVAVVSPAGQISALGDGNVTISATTNDGGFSATCNVEITEGNPQQLIVGWDFKTKNRTASAGIPANIFQQISREYSYNGIYSYSVVGAQGENDFSCSTTKWDNGINTKYWKINFTTLGYENINFSSIQRASGFGPRDFVIQYRVGNEGPWSDLANIVDGPNWVTGIQPETALPSICSNQALVQIRWVVVSNMSVLLTPIFSTQSGRIDEIMVYGDPIPVSSTPLISSISSKKTVDKQIKVYPNPTNSILNVEFIFDKPETLSLQLQDINGRIVIDWGSTEEKIQHQKLLDISSYNEGVYFLVAKSNDKTTVTKVIKIPD